VLRHAAGVDGWGFKGLISLVIRFNALAPVPGTAQSGKSPRGFSGLLQAPAVYPGLRTGCTRSLWKRWLVGSLSTPGLNEAPAHCTILSTRAPLHWHASDWMLGRAAKTTTAFSLLLTWEMSTQYAGRCCVSVFVSGWVDQAKWEWHNKQHATVSCGDLMIR
jgi:hypothetical protein